MQADITVSSPRFGSDVEASVLGVLRSGQIAQGAMVQRLEELCAAMSGTAHAVAVSNGTVALEAALEVLDLQPGDEVITSPFTFGATLNAVLHSGGRARFADIGDDFNITPASVSSLIGARTRVLLPVHLYGLMADMDTLSAMAREHGLAVVEDAAQAHGATQGARRAGGTHVGCFSFYATKNVTSAEGGVITTSEQRCADRLRILRNQGMERRYEYVAIGRNHRMTDLAAAVAVPQLERLDEINVARDRNARILSTLLCDQQSIQLPTVPDGRSHVWHQYTVLLPSAADRDAVAASMARRGVGTGVYYPRLVWDHQPYREHPSVVRDHTPRAEDAARRCLSLPVHQHLDDGDLERIASALREAVRAA